MMSSYYDLPDDCDPNSPPPGIPVEAIVRQRGEVLGWWDGSAIQPVNVLGIWDGKNVIPDPEHEG